MNNPIKIEDYEYKLFHAQNQIHYKFNDETILLQALTHPSAVSGYSIMYSYERLEFLGDSLLGSYVAQRAFELFPKAGEGKLSKVKTALVSGETLSKVAKELGLETSIIVGESEAQTGFRGMHSALENIYESICAAIWLDGGWNPLTNFIESTLICRVDDPDSFVTENPKSQLQEYLQCNKITPTYSIIDEFGPAHDKQFVAEVKSGKKTLATGQGKTKKEAEANAATAALRSLKKKKDKQ